jgi:hypothetical protein
MSASIDDVVLTSFAVDSEGLKDLDSIVRQRCQDMGSSCKITYKVTRRDSLRYTTENIEEILKERNGRESRIDSVVLRIQDERDDLKFDVSFDNRIRIIGESENRADLVLLASDIRALIRERMKTRGSISWSARTTIAIATFFLGMFGFMQFTSIVSNNNISSFDAQYRQASIVSDR